MIFQRGRERRRLEDDRRVLAALLGRPETFSLEIQLRADIPYPRVTESLSRLRSIGVVEQVHGTADMWALRPLH